MTKKESSVSTFEFNGYAGTCEASVEDGCLFGRILHISDLITYEGETVAQLKAAFEEAVTDYLAFCQSVGKNPDKPYGGSFNLRCGPELHKLLAHEATVTGVSLNEALCNILKAHFGEPTKKTENHFHITVQEHQVLHTRTAVSSSEIVHVIPSEPYVQPETAKQSARVSRRAAH